jgi:hypothetical protein
LTIVASSDLGGLGSRDGPPVNYEMVMPSLAPLLLPWLAILGLLALKPNRRAAAWWIWLPLGCVIALTLAPMEFLPPGTNFFLDVVAALGTGLGAVWLLSDHLRQTHRFVTFLCVLLALAGFSLLAFLSQQGWSFTSETLVAGIALAVSVMVSSMALGLAGLICRGRCRRVGLYGWLLILLAVLWLAITLPFFLCALIASGGKLPWSGFFLPISALVILHFATFLPFLILSWASPFYRERLQALLCVKTEPPPVIAPLPDASLTT